MASTVDLIVNPASGRASRRLDRAGRVRHAMHVLEGLGARNVRAIETRRPGDGADAAARSAAEGVNLVIAWGGDGTINEVASALVGTRTTLAIVPGGSGNGLARGLLVPLDIDAALATALRGVTRVIDVGTVCGRPFLNIAGMGFDAAIAARFNATGGTRRGLLTYLRACAAELRVHVPSIWRVRLDGVEWFAGPASLVVVANGQQYGNGARIAPAARFDDGWLDVVVVPDVTLRRIVRHGWRLVAGSIGRVPGVRTGRAREVEVVPQDPCLLHRDGETQQVTGTVSCGVRERALRVRVPE
jgi:YegS/Rv2252/BmrU family lipid kinase